MILRTSPSTADFVLAPIFGAWAAQGIAWSQSGLSGHTLPMSASANQLAVVVWLALVARFALETVAQEWYPNRLTLVSSGAPEAPGSVQRLTAVIIRALIFTGIAVAFYPLVRQLWFSVGVIVFGTLAAWENVQGRFPNNRRLHRFLPAGLPLTVVMLLAGRGMGAWLERRQPEPGRRLVEGLVYLALPSVVFTVLALVGREGERPELKWWHRIAAVPLVGLLLHLMFGWFAIS